MKLESSRASLCQHQQQQHRADSSSSRLAPDMHLSNGGAALAPKSAVHDGIHTHMDSKRGKHLQGFATQIVTLLSSHQLTVLLFARTLMCFVISVTRLSLRLWRTQGVAVLTRKEGLTADKTQGLTTQPSVDLQHAYVG